MFPNNVLKVQFFAVLDNFVGADPCVRPSNSRFVCFVEADLCFRPHTRVRSPVFGWLFCIGRTHVCAPTFI